MTLMQLLIQTKTIMQPQLSKQDRIVDWCRVILRIVILLQGHWCMLNPTDNQIRNHNNLEDLWGQTSYI